MFRHCVAGDQALLLHLARATRHLRAAWSYTHFPMGLANQVTLRQAAAPRHPGGLRRAARCARDVPA
jgi:hypothetical protein